MDPINNNPSFTPNPNMGQGVNPEHKNNKTLMLLGVLIAILAVILVLNIKTNKEEAMIDAEIMQMQEEIRANDEITQQIEVQSSSDELRDIEMDLNATNIDSLDM